MIWISIHVHVCLQIKGTSTIVKNDQSIDTPPASQLWQWYFLSHTTYRKYHKAFYRLLCAVECFLLSCQQFFLQQAINCDTNVYFVKYFIISGGFDKSGSIILPFIDIWCSVTFCGENVLLHNWLILYMWHRWDYNGNSTHNIFLIW